MADKNNTNKTKTLQDIANYTFTKGINTETSPETQPESTYRAALNVVKETENEQNFLATEYSNEFRLKLPGKVLHSNLIKQINQVVVFLSNNEIGIYDPNKNTYIKLYNNPDLNFSIYLESVSFTKTECEDIVLIFWDGVNRIRNINITKFLDNNLSDDNVEDLELFKTSEKSIYLDTVNFKENSAYNIDAGMYRPFIQYEDEDGNSTNYYIIYENIPLIEDSLNSNFEFIDGNDSKVLNKSIELTLKSVDTKFPFINIGFIKTVKGVSTAFLFKQKYPVSPEIKVTYEGDTTFNTGLNIQEVVTKRAFYLSAKHGLIYNNRLLLSGLKGKRNVDYQKYANNIDVKYITGKINLKRTKGYKNPQHIIHHKSWMRDENYMLGIVLEFEDLTESLVYPLINKKYPNFPEFTDEAGLFPANDDTKLCCNNGERQLWKEVNTAKRINEKYNPYAADLSVNDECLGNINPSSNYIRSEGYLGYYESEEKYPVIARCENSNSLDPKDYIYPVDIDIVTGKVTGKNITLFKMPDSTIEPFHNNIVDDEAITDNKNKFDSKFDEIEIYPLGIKLENVTMPTLEETDGIKVIGYRVVYVRRDSFNKSIQDKGWFVEMFKNKFNDKEYIYPKHNVNSGAKWDYFSNLRDKAIETENPVQNFVKNSGYGSHYDNGIMFYGANTLSYKPGLNVNHIKVEQQYNSIGSYIDSIDGINTSPGSGGDEVIDPSAFKDKDSRLRTTAIQIYNLYNYGYTQNNNGSITKQNEFKNRSLKHTIKNVCVDNYSYVNNNVILNKILNSDYSLVNYYREDGVYLDFKNTSNLSFNKDLKFFNSDTSAKKCGNFPSPGFEPLESITVGSFIRLSSDTLRITIVGDIEDYQINDILYYQSGFSNNLVPGTPFKLISKISNTLTIQLVSGTLPSLIGTPMNFSIQPSTARDVSFEIITNKIVNFVNKFPLNSEITVTSSTNNLFLPPTTKFKVISNTQIEVIGTNQLIPTNTVTVNFIATGPPLPPIVNFKEDYIDNKTGSGIFSKCNHGFIYYGSIKNFLPKQYGGINEMFFIDTGLKSRPSEKNIAGFYGDSYINTFSFVRTGVTGMLEDSYINDESHTWIDRNDKTYTIQNIVGTDNRSYLLNLFLPQKPNVTLLNTVIESDVNLDLRYEGPTFNEVYYPKLSNGKYYLFSNRKNEYAEDCFLNTYFYELICRNDQDNCTSTNYDEVEYNDAYKNFHNNKINLNTDYNELNGMRYNLIKPINRTYKTCDCDTEFDNRIAISTADNQSVGRLNYSKFLKNSFVTLPHKEGKITNLFKENQILYAHTTDNIWRLLTLESKLQASTTQIYLGTNDFLSSQQLELFASNEGYMGLQDKRFKFQNNAGYFFIDLKTQSVNLMSGGKLDSISSYGMSGFFRSNFKKYFNSYQVNPDLKNVEINFGYDYRHKRLLMTDKGNEFTISYYPEDKAFYSFHSYLPMAYIQSRDTFFTQSDNYDLYIHEDNFNSYRKFYGVHYPSILDGVFTYHPLLYTNFNNMGLKIDAFENVNGQQVILQEPPTSVSIWNSHQHSGEIFIKTPVNEDYMSNVVLGNQPHHFVNGVLYLNNFSNFVLDQSQPFLQGDIFKEPNNNVSFSKNWTEVNRLESNFFNYRVKIDDKDLENLKFILKFTVLNYNISMR